MLKFIEGLLPTPKPVRKGIVALSILVLFVGFGIEYGGPKLPLFAAALPDSAVLIREAEQAIDQEAARRGREPDDPQVVQAKQDAREQIEGADPPGYSLEADGLYFWTVFVSLLVSLIGMLRSRTSVIKAGMVVSLISSVIVIILLIVLIVRAIIELVVMFGLLAAAPFGPMIYLAAYAISFPRGTVLALAALGLLCKVVAAILLWVGGTQIVRARSALLLILTGFLTYLIITFGISLPRVIIPIADAIVGIVIAIVVIIWNVTVFLGSVRGFLSRT